MTNQKKIIPGSEYEFEYDKSVWTYREGFLDETNIVSVGIEKDDLLAESCFKNVYNSWLSDVWRCLKAIAPSMCLMIFLAQPTSLISTPTVRYKKLWKSIKKEYPDFLDLEETTEHEFIDGKRVRYAGISILKDKDFFNSLNFARVNKNCGIFALNADVSGDMNKFTKHLYNISFPHIGDKNEHLLNWPFFINEILSIGGIAVKPIGRYDYGGYYLDTFIRKGTFEGAQLLSD